MKIVLGVVMLLFALLHSAAASTQLKGEGGARGSLMILGSMLSIISAGLCVKGVKFDWPFALAGFALIILSAIANGKRSGNFHIAHHIVRIVVCLVLLAGVVLL